MLVLWLFNIYAVHQTSSNLQNLLSRCIDLYKSLLVYSCFDEPFLSGSAVCAAGKKASVMRFYLDCHKHSEAIKTWICSPGWKQFYVHVILSTVVLAKGIAVSVTVFWYCDMSSHVSVSVSCLSISHWKYTVHPESIHSASLFPHFVMLQPYSKMD